VSTLAIASVALTLTAGVNAAQNTTSAPAAPGAAPVPGASSPARPQYPRIDTSKMQLEAEPEHQKPDLPGWAYIPVTPLGKGGPRKPDDGAVLSCAWQR
jgi:hypothetical protein